MVTGIETVGVVLAVLPLIAKQIATYGQGIDKISRLRNYRREVLRYSRIFWAQHAILLSTLEGVLRGVDLDESMILKLICDPNDDGWRDPVLESRLRAKLGRSYEPFIGITADLFDLIEKTAGKMGIRIPGMITSAPSLTRLWWRFLLRETIYKDLLATIDDTNAILKTLLEPPSHRGRPQSSPRAWDYLLPQYKTARKHSTKLFKGIVEGTCWICDCKGDHRVQFILQSHPLKAVDGQSANGKSKFRMAFSNNGAATGSWEWGELEFQPWPTGREPPFPLIQDLCSSLLTNERQTNSGQVVGILSCEPHTTTRYTIHKLEGFQGPVVKQSLPEVLSHLSRRDRIRIAAGLSCCVLQLFGSWLKPRWNSSDIQLGVNHHQRVSLDFLILSWSLATSNPQKRIASRPSTLRSDMLVPLGCALVELSTGRPMDALCLLGRENDDKEVSKVETASKLIETALSESGSSYAKAVQSCLLWSDNGSLCLDDNSFQERFFDTIVTPLIQDLAYFE